QKAFGFKSMYAHEFSFRTWREDPTPIVEAIRGYLESDYDYPAELQAVADDLDEAKAEVFEGIEPGPARDELERALDLSLRMNPLTPDHHFYIDQGTNARVRLVLIAIGKKLVEEGRLDDPEDVMYLKYNELRRLMAGTSSFDAQELVGDRRDQREDAYELRPRDWVGTATEEAVAFPYLSLWAFPEKLNRPGRALPGAVQRRPARRDRGLPDDQPVLGRAVHQDLRSGHRRRRHGLAPRRRLPRVRDSCCRRHLGRHASDQDGRP